MKDPPRVWLAGWIDFSGIRILLVKSLLDLGDSNPQDVPGAAGAAAIVLWAAIEEYVNSRINSELHAISLETGDDYLSVLPERDPNPNAPLLERLSAVLTRGAWKVDRDSPAYIDLERLRLTRNRLAHSTPKSFLLDSSRSTEDRAHADDVTPSGDDAGTLRLSIRNVEVEGEDGERQPVDLGNIVLRDAWQSLDPQIVRNGLRGFEVLRAQVPGTSESRAGGVSFTEGSLFKRSPNR